MMRKSSHPAKYGETDKFCCQKEELEAADCSPIRLSLCSVMGVGSLKSAIVGTFTPQKLANAANPTFPCPTPSSRGPLAGGTRYGDYRWSDKILENKQVLTMMIKPFVGVQLYCLQ